MMKRTLIILAILAAIIAASDSKQFMERAQAVAQPVLGFLESLGHAAPPMVEPATSARPESKSALEAAEAIRRKGDAPGSPSERPAPERSSGMRPHTEPNTTQRRQAVAAALVEARQEQGRLDLEIQGLKTEQRVGTALSPSQQARLKELETRREALSEYFRRIEGLRLRLEETP